MFWSGQGRTSWYFGLLCVKQFLSICSENRLVFTGSPAYVIAWPVTHTLQWQLLPRSEVPLVQLRSMQEACVPFYLICHFTTIINLPLQIICHRMTEQLHSPHILDIQTGSDIIHHNVSDRKWQHTSHWNFPHI